jgi:aryl-alcohol dehydrogenase-like predicted oxidoreductase
VLALKIYWATDPDDQNARGLNRKHLRRQLNRILDRLRTNYLDLLCVHRWDRDTPVREFLRSLNSSLRTAGPTTSEPQAAPRTLSRPPAPT